MTIKMDVYFLVIQAELMSLCTNKIIKKILILMHNVFYYIIKKSELKFDV